METSLLERTKQLVTPGGFDDVGLRGFSVADLHDLIVRNPWYDPDLREKRNGNAPDTIKGIPLDFPGVIAPPRNSLGWQETLTAATTSGPAKASWTTAVTAINPQNQIVFPANYFQRIGQTIRITVMGGLGTLVTTPGTTTYQVQLGPTANIIAYTSGAIQLNATAHTLIPFSVQIMMTLRATGSGTSANFIGQGTVQGVMYTLTAAQIDAVNTSGIYSAPATAPAVGTGFDSTVANLFDFYTARSISDPANTQTVHIFTVESLN